MYFVFYENITNSTVPCCSITHFSASVFNATSFSICHIPFRTTRHHRLHSEGARGNPSLNHLYFLHHEKVEAPQTVAEAPSPPIPFLSAPQYENHANHENLRNPVDNQKKNENHRNPFEKNENHENHRITLANYKNHENQKKSLELRKS